VVLEMLECWKAGKLGSPKVYNSRCSIAFELSSLIAFQPPSKTLTFDVEPRNPTFYGIVR
jgi:hypothetical protein